MVKYCSYQRHLTPHAAGQMNREIRRTPKDYKGTQLTTHRFCDLLPHVLAKIGEVYQDRPDLILASWPDVVGPQIASMTQAISFVDGILLVRVRNSTLYSLLSQNDKPAVLARLRMKFPKVKIFNIHFRLG